MKKAFLVLPFAIILANCSSTRNTSNSSANTGMSTSGSTASSTSTTDATASGSVSASPSGASASGTTGVSGSNTAGMSASGSSNSASMNTAANTASYGNNSTTKASGSVNWDVYDPNNYMMNPDKYLRPDQLGKAGGWTYNKDWRRNTNFTPEAVGQWQLVLTPEVAANWLPDTRRPETYASFWTPEAVMARYEAQMAAIKKSSDSLIAVYAALNPEPVAGKAGKKGTAGRNMASSTTNTDTAGSTSANTESVATTGSGTTGTMGTGGVSSATTTDSASGANGSNSIVPYALTAINGNKFMLPTLNMYIDNGSFTAYTGCNTAVGTIVVNGSSLKFEEATPNTDVQCIGGFDQTAFIEKLKRADSYDVVNNQFRLKQGDQVLMVFAKNAL